jgi:hypothetical protein
LASLPLRVCLRAFAPSRFNLRFPSPGDKRCGLALAVAAILLAGCDRDAAAPAAARPTVAPGPCAIAGVVRYSGPAVQVETPEGQCCPGVPRPADEAVVVNPNGTLANVTVYIDGGPNVAGPAPAEAVLTQQGCRYVPHVLALRVGQKLVVTSHDPTMHDVLIEPTSNPGDHFSEYDNGSHAVTFGAADESVRFSCHVHPWMRAFARVFDHPCYAVTGGDGSFRIGQLPPGTYTLVAHQERFEDQRQSVTVSAGKPTVDVTFDFHP